MPPYECAREARRCPRYVPILDGSKELIHVFVEFVIRGVGFGFNPRLNIGEGLVQVYGGEFELGGGVQCDIGLRRIEGEIFPYVLNSVEGGGGFEGDGLQAGERGGGGDRDG